MKKITIEFFHDVICSYCFPMSYKMRRLAKENPDIEIIHRSFALVNSMEDFKLMFGSREAAKGEIVPHWEHANQVDELHRFNIEGMLKQDFPFPISMPALYAVKAAGILGGQLAYWDMFDNLQHAFFVESKNVEENEVIYECVKKAGLNFDEWKNSYDSDQVKGDVEEDFKLVHKYGIDVVPTLIINGKYKISGAQPYDDLLKAINKITDEGKSMN
ncbi:DsbA family oxidoreductase [Metaclostridioides mangenotii]|uniref:DsbA family oxidoreductase n=1 Tax=Metaclostridioides mangenotii TaxID=1540 RepID=UPI0004B77060|nr:DsbA family protein [Clostridioides mangenotii]